ncbi:MAG: alpha/beta hydrolase-fold protein [Vicinamibacterales bacterium]
MIARTLLATAAVLASAAGARADTPITGRLTSTALGEVRQYTVRLPASYARDSTRRYPVIYVLDGPPLDAHTAAAAAEVAAAGDAPELIVVGIPNMQRGGRARDFLPPYLSFRAAMARRSPAAPTGSCASCVTSCCRESTATTAPPGRGCCRATRSVRSSCATRYRPRRRCSTAGSPTHRQSGATKTPSPRICRAG